MIKEYPNSLLLIFGTGIIIVGLVLFFKEEFYYRSLHVEVPWTYLVGLLHVIFGGVCVMVAIRRWK